MITKCKSRNKEFERFLIRDSEAGNIISSAPTLAEAQNIVGRFEAEDRKDDIFVENFYEIFDSNNEEIIQ